MIISVPERGTADLDPGAWQALSGDHRFWRLVDDNIVQPEAGGSGRWRLRGSCHVGRAVFGNVTLEVVEKFGGAFETLIALGVTVAPTVASAPSPVAPLQGSTALLVSLFIRAARAYLSGFKKVAYVSVPDSGALVGGRLHVARTARMRARGIFHQVAFERSFLSGDVPLNRCVYAALREVERLARVTDVAVSDIASARALRMSLSECLPSVLASNRSDLAALAAQHSSLSRARPEVSNVASLAGAVLDAAGFGGSDAWKRTVERSWFVNLETFFEAALRRVIRNTMTDIAEVTGPRNRPSLFSLDRGRYRANPDIVIYQDGEVTAICDAKYKDFTDWPTTSDVHEIIAHAATYGASLAILFYPDDNGFSIREFGQASTGCVLWAFGIDFSDFAGSVRSALAVVGFKIESGMS